MLTTHNISFVFPSICLFPNWRRTWILVQAPLLSVGFVSLTLFFTFLHMKGAGSRMPLHLEIGSPSQGHRTTWPCGAAGGQSAGPGAGLAWATAKCWTWERPFGVWGSRRLERCSRSHENIRQCWRAFSASLILEVKLKFRNAFVRIGVYACMDVYYYVWQCMRVGHAKLLGQWQVWLFWFCIPAHWVWENQVIWP